jgi:DNA-binding transcriptional ArsR family regulator
MLQVRTTEVSSRLGDFTLIKLGEAVLISQCDTRMKILKALAEGPLTSEELRQKLRISYSSVMDHMEFFETIGLVKPILATRDRNQKRNGKKKGRRRITFHLNENPLERIEELFMTAPRNGRGRSTSTASVPSPVPV